MKHKRTIQKAIAILVVILVIGFLPSVASARGDDRFVSYSATLTSIENGDLCVYFRVVARNTMDTIGVSNINIQWYNGSRWVGEKTYTSTDIPELLKSNSASHSDTVTYTPTHSGSYRAVVTFYAKDSTGVSTKQTTT